MLDVRLFVLTNCNTNCSTTAKYWKNMAFKKKIQSYSFGDQQLTESLLHRHILVHSLIYFNNTFNYGNGLSHAVISWGCSSHQFKLQKEHKSRMDTRLSSLSHQYEQPHMYTWLLQELFLPWDCNCAVENLPPEIIASTLPCSFR